MSSLYRTKSISALASFILLGSSAALCQEQTELPAPSTAPAQMSEEKTATEIELEAVWQDGPKARLKLKNSEDSHALEQLLFDFKYEGEESESGLSVDGTIDGNLGQVSFYNKARFGERIRTLTEWKRDLEGNTLRGEFLATLLGQEEWSICQKLRQDETFKFKSEQTELSVALPAFTGGLMKLTGSKSEQGSAIVGEIRGQVSEQINLGLSVRSKKISENSENTKPATSWAPEVESKLRWVW